MTVNLSSAFVASLALLAKAVSAVTPSPGCSVISPPNPASGSWDANVDFLGTDYSHKYSYPSQVNGPVPLLMYFHGWGGGSGSCGSTCTSADERGYATISLTGIGGENGDNNSWNGFGSTESGVEVAIDGALTAGTDNCGDDREDDRTCNVNAYNVGCYQDCAAACADDCWWTTCKDSVQQTLDVLMEFTDNYCVDMDRVYASGCSNGGMFVYELANNVKSYSYFAGIATQVGLPHYGYNHGPYKDAQNNATRINHIGFWGSRDRIVPPTENASGTKCLVPGRTSEGRGWFYTSSDYVMEKWATVLGISTNTSLLTKYGIPDESALSECTAYGAEDDVVVLGCIFTGGHVCNQGYMNDVMLNFFDELDGPNTNPDPTSAPTSGPTGSGTPAPPNCVAVGGSCAGADKTCCGQLTCPDSNPKKCE